MTEQYFKDKWHNWPSEIYAGLVDMDTMKATLESVGVVRSFALIADLKKVYESEEHYEKCINLQSIELGLKNGLDMEFIRQNKERIDGAFKQAADWEEGIKWDE